ncbi:GDSL-type esterase/lipase family protein [Streptomyces sp. HPF1205]|uniref:GDSL-type esterase/lipase family protein n=1 Tax=Streptomyces sp. HPF1205 TaxID=2873262 RepID=UPI001CECBEBE|nr:GDSL-type esterase/lipase family protein [Streptomyces sp. HPF1205]
MTRTDWTTAHLAAMAWADPASTLVPGPRDMAGRTVRQSVRLRRGGDALRLVLSNEYGDRPLVIARVTARAGGVTRDVRLHGAARWEIAAGERAASDPVPLPTTAGDELLVGCFLPGPGPAPSTTFLHSAQRTGLHAAGDRLDEPVMPGAEPFTSLYWIARVLVDAPATGPVVIAYGDSITRGDATTPDRDQRYPDHLQLRLLAARTPGTDGAVVLNAGLGGNRLLGPGIGPSMADRFARDVLAVPEATHVIIMGGVNDIASAPTDRRSPADGQASLPGRGPARVDGPVQEDGRADEHGRARRPPILDARRDAILGGLYGLAARARRHGIRPVLGTITPFGGSLFALGAEEGEEVRRAVNEALSAQRDWPIADFAAAVADPADPTRLAAPFDSGDGVHPSDAGAAALAGAVDLAIPGIGGR